MSKKKFYAVRTGRKSGIYENWFGPDGAEVQVKGFNGAEFKGFLTLAEAQTWMGMGFYSDETTEKEQPPIPKIEMDTDPGDMPGGDPVRALADGRVVIYTDGACEGNPGRGGYGVVLLYKERRKELSAGYRQTTNNRMELLACIVGLEALKQSSSVLLFSDSQYVVNGINRGWAEKWRNNGWMRNKKEKAENADLWTRLLDLCKQHEVQFIWVRGHAGNPENERCDRLSVQSIHKHPLLIDTNYEN